MDQLHITMVPTGPHTDHKVENSNNENIETSIAWGLVCHVHRSKKNGDLFCCRHCRWDKTLGLEITALQRNARAFLTKRWRGACLPALTGMVFHWG